MVHDEVNRGASSAAGETLADVFSGRDIERGTLVVVERTEAHIVYPALAKGYEFRHHINNVGGL